MIARNSRSGWPIAAPGRPYTTVAMRMELSPEQAMATLEVDMATLAELVRVGLLWARLPLARGTIPRWEDLRFDGARAIELRPEQIERARAHAPRWRTEEVARASALGAVISTLRIPS